MDNIKLLYLALAITIFGLIIAATVIKRNGYVDFLGRAHWWSLVFMVAASILTWAAMVWMAHPSSFRVGTKQWVAFAMTILIGILIWARYAYSVSEDDKSK